MRLPNTQCSEKIFSSYSVVACLVSFLVPRSLGIMGLVAGWQTFFFLWSLVSMHLLIIPFSFNGHMNLLIDYK